MGHLVHGLQPVLFEILMTADARSYCVVISAPSPMHHRQPPNIYFEGNSVSDCTA